MEREIVIDGRTTGWLVSDEGYTIDTWGGKATERLTVQPIICRSA